MSFVLDPRRSAVALSLVRDDARRRWLASSSSDPSNVVKSAGVFPRCRRAGFGSGRDLLEDDELRVCHGALGAGRIDVHGDTSRTAGRVHDQRVGRPRRSRPDRRPRARRARRCAAARAACADSSCVDLAARYAQVTAGAAPSNGRRGRPRRRARSRASSARACPSAAAARSGHAERSTGCASRAGAARQVSAQECAAAAADACEAPIHVPPSPWPRTAAALRTRPRAIDDEQPVRLAARSGSSATTARRTAGFKSASTPRRQTTRSSRENGKSLNTS